MNNIKDARELNSIYLAAHLQGAEEADRNWRDRSKVARLA